MRYQITNDRIAKWSFRVLLGSAAAAVVLAAALLIGGQTYAQGQSIQWGQAQGVVPIQGVGSFAANSEGTSAANAPVTTTVTGVNRAALWKVTARCSAGTAVLTVKDGATQIWSTPAAAVGTSNFTEAWQTALTSSTASLVVTLGTCGVSNTGTLDVQASSF